MFWVSYLTGSDLLCLNGTIKSGRIREWSVRIKFELIVRGCAILIHYMYNNIMLVNQLCAKFYRCLGISDRV